MRRSDFRNFLKDKRGVELTLNTVIIAILVVLVLIVVIGFFLGGTSKAKDTIADIFSAGVAGSDIGLAVQQCENYCDQAAEWSDKLKKSSPFCKKEFHLDFVAPIDGEADLDKEDKEDKEKKPHPYKCEDEPLSVSCPEITSCK